MLNTKEKIELIKRLKRELDELDQPRELGLLEATKVIVISVRIKINKRKIEKLEYMNRL